MAFVTREFLDAALEKLYPWKSAAYDVDAPSLSEAARAACIHEWVSPSSHAHLMRICSTCGLVEVRPRPEESPQHCMERAIDIMRNANRCYFCGRPEAATSSGGGGE